MRPESPTFSSDRNELHAVFDGRMPFLSFLRQARAIREQTQAMIDRVTADIEADTADQLCRDGIATLNLTDEELPGIFGALIARVVSDAAPVATTYVYPEFTFIGITGSTLSVQSLIHIHSPVTAFIPIRYDLTNSRDGRNLRLVPGSLGIETHTPERLGFIQRQILARFDMARIASRALSDPRQLILDTLPGRLERYGFDGGLSDAALRITPEATLSVSLQSRTAPSAIQ